MGQLPAELPEPLGDDLPFDPRVACSALVGWVSRTLASAFPGVVVAVVVRDQSAPQPDLPYVTIRLGDLEVVGGLDEVRTTYNPVSDQLVHQVVGFRRFEVEFASWTRSSVDDGSSPHAPSLLTRLQVALGLPSTSDAFDAANIALEDEGTVQDLAGLLGSSFQGRAVLRMRFQGVDEVQEGGGYISKVVASGTYA